MPKSWCVLGGALCTGGGAAVAAACAAGEPALPSTAAAASGAAAPSDAAAQARVLLFTRTQGFRHGSIADAQQWFAQVHASQRLSVEQSEAAESFSDAQLARFDVVAFVNTTGDVLDETQQQALQRFVRNGGGFVGVHAAADTEHAWAWYGQLVGAYFVNHPEQPLPVQVSVEKATDRELLAQQSVAHWPDTFEFTDEWYNFDRNPRGSADILLRVDEAGFVLPNTPAGPSMGADHPVAWAHEFEGGRSFYTNLGHRPETWADPHFGQHLVAGIQWAAGN